MHPPAAGVGLRHVHGASDGWGRMHGGAAGRRAVGGGYGGRSARALGAAGVLALLLLTTLTTLVPLVPSAAAHPDLVVGEGTHRLAPGATLTTTAEVHYHRLVGHVRAEDPAARLTVLVTGPDGERVVAGPGADLQVNALIACCGTSNVPHPVTVRNAGPSPVTVTVRLVLLHDGLAVVNDDSEPGALRSVVAMPLLGAVGFGLTLWRPLAASAADARRATRRGAVALALLWVLAAGLAGWGMLRYGGGPAVGTLAATADLPSTNNVIMTTHSVITVGFILLWIACTGLWTASARRAGTPEARRAAGWLGLALGGSALVACAAWAIEYGTVLAPLLTFLAAATLPLGGAARLLRRGVRPARDDVAAESLPPG